MGKITCKKLADLINENSLFELQVEEHNIKNLCEAFGRDVQCFIRFASKEDKVKFKDVMHMNDVKMNRWDVYNGVSVSVSYFKAQGWDA